MTLSAIGYYYSWNSLSKEWPWKSSVFPDRIPDASGTPLARAFLNRFPSGERCQKPTPSTIRAHPRDDGVTDTAAVRPVASSSPSSSRGEADHEALPDRGSDGLRCGRAGWTMARGFRHRAGWRGGRPGGGGGATAPVAVGVGGTSVCAVGA